MTDQQLKHFTDAYIKMSEADKKIFVDYLLSLISSRQGSQPFEQETQYQQEISSLNRQD